MATYSDTPALTAEKDRAAYPEFSAPPGFVAPEGTEPGTTFPVVVELKTKPDGKLCLVSIEGAEYRERDPEEPDDDSYEEEEVVATETPAGPMEEEVDMRGFAERLGSLG